MKAIIAAVLLGTLAVACTAPTATDDVSSGGAGAAVTSSNSPAWLVYYFALATPGDFKAIDLDTLPELPNQDFQGIVARVPRCSSRVLGDTLDAVRWKINHETLIVLRVDIADPASLRADSARAEWVFRETGEFVFFDLVTRTNNTYKHDSQFNKLC